MLLSGCSGSTPESVDDNSKFNVYKSEKYLEYTEYQVSDLDQLIILYFPVITNKIITSTEFGGAGANLSKNSGGLKVRLKADVQDRLNEEYNGYYISFLKYQVIIENTANVQVNDYIELCDTKLWIHNEEEFETVEFVNKYLRINLVANENITLPDWGKIVDKMKDTIKNDLE